MKRKNWTSLFVALAMILSMATIILLPTGAEELDFDAMPLASTAVRGDGVDEYKIDSVAELLNTCKVLKLRGYGASATSGGPESGKVSGDQNYTIWNFEPTDTIYLTADLDIADWDYTSVATYDTTTGLYTPNFYANMDTNNSDRINLTYVDNTNGSVTAGSLQELFSLMYSGFSWGWSAGRGYSVMCATIDGLGHTISNYYDTHSFFRGSFVGLLQNVVFENALVEVDDVKDYGYYQASIIAASTNQPEVIGWATSYGATFNNVHLVNSTLVTPVGAKDVGLFFGAVNKATSAVNIKNSSIVNCTLDSAQATASNANVGFVAGYLNTTVDIENSLFLNNTLQAENALSYKNGLLLGNSARNANLNHGFTNVAVVGNKVIAPNAGENAVIVHAANDYAQGTTANNLYIAENVYATSADGAESPMTVAFNFHGESDYYMAPTFTNVVTDAGVRYLMQNDAAASASILADPANVDPTLTADSAASKLNTTLPEGAMYWALRKDGNPTTTASADGLPHSITFIDGENQFTVQTDYEQAVIVDPETLVFLTLNEWDAAEGKNAQPGTDWSTKQNPVDNTYTLVPHDVEYTSNDDGSHTAYCNTCENEIHNGTHSCQATAPTGVFVAGDYYNEAVWEYTCLACGNVLTEIDDAETEALPAPFAVEFEKALYSNVDESISVTFTAPADANLVAFTAIVTFDPAVMTYKNSAPADPAYACVVNAAEAADGKLIVSVPSLDGSVLTDAEAVLNFDFDPYAGSNTIVESVSVQAELISALVYSQEDGTVERIADVVKKVSEDVVAVIFVEPNVLPGDVDNNGVVELLDAVILIEKISGQIHASQDGEAFFIMASDVNEDGLADRNDAETIMDYVADESTALYACEEIPTIVYDE